MAGAFQVGPFQVNFQQETPTPPNVPTNQFPIQSYVGLDWYDASNRLVQSGLVQQDPPNLVRIGPFMLANPGQVLAQIPEAGTYVSPGTAVHLTVAFEFLLGATFNMN